MKTLMSTVVGLALWLVSSGAVALESAKPYSIDRTYTHSITSSINGKEYELYVRVPRSYETSDKRYPLAVLNDTGASFPTVSGVLQLLTVKDMQEIVAVGISYSVGDDGGVSRTRDYTPTFAPDETSFHSVASKQASGHASDYLAFIERDVFPFLASQYRLNMDSKALIGHSFGGLLGAYALVTKPTLFDHYIIGSPSLWYDDKVMFDLERKYAKSNNMMPANVYMYVGDKENNNTHSMVDDLKQYEAQLRQRQYKGLSLQVEIVPEATHHSAFPHLLTYALPRVFPLD
ncbi:alpha/beta hydrolase-fold protein [Gilvimarinus sp. SDUM040013]|uniref:Alpha/beta hydrolase-fold protein n=1 Tax=Gilvimarinus gilvus TaxID=3058038 RepID=A0ABU4S0R3_9GAMM|nr:alpha/beta hydrolase-fold protein [Gilvimarinus sp. SDUM040013]MDO3386685.1 alpha/beta hydrolase-fold protein [Gilvimarinus sp. SDUM040013]MDX6849428.1 alpha/beta hydrolase-fold protein [Gilvimarinus sp. SDUM040013]